MRGQIRNSGRAFWGLVPAAWEVRTGSLLSPQGGVSTFLTWGQGGGLTHVGSGWGPDRGLAGGVAQVVCPPLWWWCVQGACAIPCFCSWPLLLLWALQKWQLGFLVSLYLSCRICPNCPCSAVFSSRWFFAGVEVRPGVGTVAKGARSQPISWRSACVCREVLTSPSLATPVCSSCSDWTRATCGSSR